MSSDVSAYFFYNLIVGLNVEILWRFRQLKTRQIDRIHSDLKVNHISMLMISLWNRYTSDTTRYCIEHNKMSKE